VVQKLDPEVVYMDKTEKWCKLRVHGVALDRYIAEDGLELARKEIELMTGEQLPYVPRWIKGDTLGERYENGTIKRSTLVLTVKSKQAAGTIIYQRIVLWRKATRDGEVLGARLRRHMYTLLWPRPLRKVRRRSEVLRLC
jgi:hypothetical protein